MTDDDMPATLPCNLSIDEVRALIACIDYCERSDLMKDHRMTLVIFRDDLDYMLTKFKDLPQ